MRDSYNNNQDNEIEYDDVSDKTTESIVETYDTSKFESMMFSLRGTKLKIPLNFSTDPIFALECQVLSKSHGK